MAESRGRIHHIDLTVTDPDASSTFYDAVLGFMGYRRSDEDAEGIDWDLSTPGTFCSIGIKRAKDTGGTHDRSSPGLHHLAWTAESRDEVDRLHALLLEIRATVLDAP